MNIQSQPSDNNEGRFDTHCLGCCFQHNLDCTIGNIVKFRKQNVEIKIEDNATKIIGRICPCFRNKAWQEKYYGREYPQIKHEIQVKYDAIVLVNSAADLVNAITYFNKATIRPQQIIAASHTVKLVELSKVFQDSKTDIKWRTEFIYQKESPWTFVEEIDFLAGKCASRYFTPVLAEEIYSERGRPASINKLNELVTFDLLPVIVYWKCNTQIGLRYFGSYYSRHAWKLIKSVEGLVRWCSNEKPELIKYEE